MSGTITHRVEVTTEEPTPFQRVNGFAPGITARCTCGWRTRALFTDTARRAADAHLREHPEHESEWLRRARATGFVAKDYTGQVRR